MGIDRRGWNAGWIGGSAVAAFTVTALAFATPAMGAQSHWDPVAGRIAGHTRRGVAGHPAGRVSRVHARRSGSEGEPDDGGAGGAAQPGGRRAVGHRRLAARAGRRDAALRDQGVADHGGRPRGRASGDQDLRGRGDRRPDGDAARGHDPARLPRLGPLGQGRVVRRSLLPPRHERLRQLLRPRPQARTASSRRARRTCWRRTRATSAGPPRRPGRTSSCAPTGWRSSPTRPTPPTSAPPT